MDQSLIMHPVKSFDMIMASVITKLTPARVECAALRKNPEDVLLEMMALEVGLEEFPIAVFERTTSGASKMFKLFQTKVTDGVVQSFVEVK